MCKLNVLRSVRKVGVKPREGKTDNAKIRVESIQKYLVVYSVESRREADHDGAVTISIYVEMIVENPVQKEQLQNTE